MKVTTLLFFILTFSFTQSHGCTLGVANGNATADGRPMLWKTRDYEVKPNDIFYTKTEKYSFVSNITPEYGWTGLGLV